MPVKTIAMFNHKGGVSKTTSAFHIAWMLAEMQKTVLMVDGDPQCNLTGIVLGSDDFSAFEQFFKDEPDRNIKRGLQPAFEAEPRAIQAVDPLNVQGRSQLHLLPGHIELSEYEVTLSIAHELSGTIHTLKNVPGAAAYIIHRTAEAINADYVFIDLNPSLSALNQNLLLTSDYFIVPNSPDYFSLMALKSLCRVLPAWKDWLDRAQAHPGLAAATYKLPGTTPKFLGTLIQNFRLRRGDATEAYREWIDRIGEVVREELFPALSQKGMTLSDRAYEAAKSADKDYCIGLVPDYNTLQAKSQIGATPVFALSDAQIGHTGNVLKQNQKKREEFHSLYKEIASRIAQMTE